MAGDQLLAGGAKPLLQKAVQSWLQQSAQETHSHAQTGGILLNALSVLLSRIKRQSFFNSPELLQLLEHLPWPSGFLQPAIMLTALLDSKCPHICTDQLGNLFVCFQSVVAGYVPQIVLHCLIQCTHLLRSTYAC